jgi:hypothetical protein
MKSFFKRIIRPICYLSITFCLCMNVGVSKATTTLSSTFAGQWPYHSSKSIAMNSHNQLLYLGDGDSINILDSDLNFISSFKVTETSQIGGIFYSAADNLLYAACRTEGLKIYDLTDTENPVLVNSYIPDFVSNYPNPETVGVFIDDSKAYLPSGIDGMIILDISDINNPIMLSQSRLYGGFGISYAIDIYASGNYAYVADLYNGLHIVEVTNPKEPDYKKGIALAGATDIAVSGDYLYLTLQSSGMSILDISTPLDTYATSGFAADDVATSVRVDGMFAYISYSFTGVRALDITNKAEPFYDSAWIYPDSGGSSLGLFPDANDIFFADDQFGLQKLDITDKSNMQPLASHDTPADAVALDVSGNYIYSVDNTVGNTPEKEGLRIHQISTSNKVALFTYKGFCATPGTATDIQADGGFAYVADGLQGLQILNTGDKTNPIIIGNYDTSGNACGIFIDGEHAYVADGDQGIVIIDITDKSNPTFTANLDIDGYARKIFVYKDYAFVAADDQGLIIINISNITSPVITGIYDTPGTANGVFVKDIYAYVADGEKGISIIDITDKTSPTLTGSLETAGFAENISVSVNYVYVADGQNGLTTINASNPSLPVPINEWSYNSPGLTTDVFSGYFTDDEEIYTFIADGGAGIIAINLSVDEEIDSDDTSGGGSSGGCFIQMIK